MKIRILHLSDLHFGLKDNNINVLKSSFIEKIQQISVSKKEWSPDFIVVSGDISNDGSTEQFISAELFLNDLKDKLVDSTSVKILCVAGNHDKRRHDLLEKIEITETFEKLQTYCQDKLPEDILSYVEPELNAFEEKLKIDVLLKAREKNKYYKERSSLFDSPNNINNFTDRYFKEYTEFAKKFLDGSSNWIPVSMNGKIIANYLVGIFHNKTIGVIFVLLNTSWLCENSHRDRGNLSFGDPIITAIENILKDILTEGEIVITVMHHCPNSFQWSDIHNKNNSINNLQKISTFSNIILSGHEHGAQIDKPDFIDNDAQLFNTGTFCSKEQSNFTCSMYKIDTLEKTINIKSLRYTIDSFTSSSSWEEKDIEQTFSLLSPTLLLDDSKRLINENKKLSWLLYKKYNKLE